MKKGMTKGKVDGGSSVDIKEGDRDRQTDTEGGERKKGCWAGK